MDWLATLSGFFVGLVVGLTGVGGGSLMTPLLVLVFGVAPVTAVGTDLLFASLTKTGGAWAHARRGNVDWKVVGTLAAGSVPASAATLALLHFFVPHPDRLSAIVSVALGVALILTAGALVFGEELHSWSKRRAPAGVEPRAAPHPHRGGDTRRAGHSFFGGRRRARRDGTLLSLSGPCRRAHRRHRHRARGTPDARRRPGPSRRRSIGPES